MDAIRARVIVLALPLAVTTLAGPRADARVVSYAPVTAKQAIPAVQERLNRRFVLVESETVGWWGGGPTGLPNPAWGIRGRLVVHDATGAEEPRVVFPPGGGEASIALVAAQEARDGSLRILTVSDAGKPADAAGTGLGLHASPDGGRTWKKLTLPDGLAPPQTWSPIWFPSEDFGGPVCRGRNPYVRIGNDRAPFVVTLARKGQPAAVAAVTAEGTVRPLAQVFGGSADGEAAAQLVGGSANGEAFLLTGRAGAWGVVFVRLPDRGVYRVTLGGDVESVLDAKDLPDAVEGWLTPKGAAYLEVLWYGTPRPPLGSPRGLFFVADRRAALVFEAPPAAVAGQATLKTGLFAIPTAAFDGAWAIQRGPGLPTVLSGHTESGGRSEAWRDVTAPEVEALHAGASGRRLLVQVHRPRAQADQRIFQDPALGLWEAGAPAPRRYDELFLVEQQEKGFVHLDVDAVAEGAPFVFDSGVPRLDVRSDGSGGAPSAGGADVVQEWGVVKASLRQRLVVPAVARTAGAAGTFWRTDLVLQNPSREAVRLEARLVPGFGEERRATVTLAPFEIRAVPDALAALFRVESGSGALFLEPEGLAAVQATSRTSTAGPSGSYGLALAAVDVFARSSARFPVSFAAALQGAGTRTNAGAVNVGERPAEVGLRAADGSGWTGRDDVVVPVPAGGFGQWNGVAEALGVPPWQTAALSVAPRSGEVVPFVIAIDEKTNDPTAFPPDLPASIVRTIPAIVHAGGRDGARYRTDLFLYNAADDIRQVTLAARPWDGAAAEKIVTLTLLPCEARVVRDALRTAFGLEGVARLRFQSGGGLATTGVRVTSRTYTERADGGTYGLVVPPLNSFQAAGPGEALEILGPIGGPRFRTNLALVDLTAFPEGPARRVEVEVVGGEGRTLDRFTVNVPPAGGLQIDDLFRSRGLGDGPPACALRIRPAAGLVGAYATTIDQGTNDPAYHGAALAASE